MHAAAQHDLAGSARAFLREAALLPVRALNRAGAPALLPADAPVRKCLNQCADEHFHYYRREQKPTNHPGWRDALVHLFETTGTRDPRLTLLHPRGLRRTPTLAHG